MKRDAYYLFPIAVSLALGGWGETMVARAQIVPDATLPMNSIVTPNGETLTIDGGTQAGGNLFHSFEAFSLPSGEAFFNNGLSVENIITRVTGGSLSEINGQIRANGMANLFLLNPNGIAFGPNARLHIGGSFVGSTADRVLFEDGRFYSATDTAGSSPLLTVNVPIGLQFGPTPGGIEVSGDGHNLRFEDVMLPLGEKTERLVRDRPVGLQVQPNQTLALVGGNVTLEGGSLTAAGNSTVSGGRIELGSVAGNNTVALTPVAAGWQLGYEGVSNFQDIQLSSAASVDTSGAGAGAIQIYGRSLSLLDGSAILALTLGEEPSKEPPSGDVTIFASESVEAIGTVEILEISTDLQDLNTPVFPSGIIADVEVGASRNGGSITINTERLTLMNGGRISTQTNGTGQGGNLTIQATELVEVIHERSLPNGVVTHIRATVGREKTGNGGQLTIETDLLRVEEGADISTTTLGTGNGGNLTIVARDIELVGTVPKPKNGNPQPSRLESQTLSNSSGTAGNITVQTERLFLADGARISVSTNGTENSGNIMVHATEVELRGSSSLDNPSGLFAQGCFGNTCAPNTGNAGNITLTADRLTVRDGATITVSSRRTGNTGNLIFNVNRLFLDGGFLSATASELTEGNGGKIRIKTVDLGLWNGSEITTEANGGSNGGSNGGNIEIDTDRLIILDNSRINANAFGGKGGNIRIVAEGLLSNVDPDRQITASSQLGIDGEITINNSETHSSNGLLELPETPIDVTALIEEDFCKPGLTSEFVVTGRGGLPPTPLESIGNEAAIQVDLVTLSPELASLAPAEEFRSEPVLESPPQRPERLVEAQGWIVGPHGEIILTAHPPQVTPHAVEPGYNACDSSDSL